MPVFCRWCGVAAAGVVDLQAVPGLCWSHRPHGIPAAVSENHAVTVEPLPVETVHALADAVPARYRALVILAAGSGMRQGECLGLTVDRLDFLRRVVHVDRQLVTVTGRPSFLTAPKTAASVRAIPLPQVVLDALAAHLGTFPPLGDGSRSSQPQAIPSVAPRSGMCGGLPSAAGAPAGTGFSSVAAFLCQLVDQAWRECQDGASAARSQVGERDARYLLPPLARQRRSHPHGGRFCTFADSVRAGEVVEGHNP